MNLCARTWNSHIYSSTALTQICKSYIINYSLTRVYPAAAASAAAAAAAATAHAYKDAQALHH